jgi:Pectate lyase superfamily protein
MRTRWLAVVIGFAVLLSTAAFGSVVPTPAYPGAAASLAYKISVDGQPVFVHRFPTFNQFQWMDYGSITMTGKVHVTITSLVNDRNVITCSIRPLAYGIHPQVSGNTISFDLDQPRYLVLFFNEKPTFQSPGLLLFADPPEQNVPRPGDPKVVNILDYKVDNTGKTLETAKINQAIGDVSAHPGGGVLFFPPGVYLTGTVLMRSNVKLYVDSGALIRGSRKATDYSVPPSPPGTRPLNRALVLFDNVENAGIAGRGAIDMQGYPWLWHDYQPDIGDGSARSEEGLVNDPHGPGIKGYIVNKSRNISFEGLLLLRSAYWTVTVSDTENFTATNIKIVNRKQQYHDDAFDFTGNSRHLLVQDSFAMTMDDTFAFYGGPRATIEDVVVKNFVNYTYTSALAIGYGGAPNIRHLRFDGVHFISNQNKFAVWIQLTPAYFVGKGYTSGQRSSEGIALDDFRFVNSTFENDGGHIYIDGGNAPLTHFVFENCTFGEPNRPGELMGTNAAPVLFKNVKMNGETLRNVDQLKRNGYEVYVPVKFEP